MFLMEKEVLKKAILLVKIAAPILTGKATKYYVNKEINKLNKKFTLSKVLGITIKSNKRKDIMKVIKS